MLAHKASEEGVWLVERLAGEKPNLDYNLIPGVVYTWPEVAGIGKTEQQLKDEDKNTDEILGVHMMGARVADLIAEAVVAMEYRASAEDIGRMVHAHPTFAEAIKEAALDAWEGKPIHS
ncbi:unnamed protein product [Cyprideis torosa]|uniref:Uncharacterized protein n=1 Tax=Cyprideis torosa TaxID=163714 RepID=A0A7R8WSJ9_9CRUS|nr:unnamed protein product [Cyprideis torosa]CAG0904915.1 unnamed protein product [Cyprideis torosa]